MEHNPCGQQRLRSVIICIACVDIFYSSIQLGLGICTRKSSFTFNAVSLNGTTEGPEVELNITVPSRSVMDMVSVTMALLLLLGVVQRKVWPVLIWIFCKIQRLAWEINIIIVYSPPWISVRFACWSFYVVIVIFMLFKLREILNEVRKRPTPSEQLLQGEGNPPSYEDVMSSCVEAESEIPFRGYGSSPPCSQCV